MEVIFFIVYPVVFLPYLALVPAVCFSYIYYKTRGKMNLITAFLWAIYGAYEYLMYMRVLCSGECNIRVDLLAIAPILFFFTLLALAMLFIRKVKN